MCKYPDAQILLEDVRRARQWRAWLLSGGVVLTIGVLLTIFGWLFSVGTEVGATERDIEHIEEAMTRGQSERNELRREHIQMERDNAMRFESIRSSLHGMERDLSKVSQQVDDMTPKRRR